MPTPAAGESDGDADAAETPVEHQAGRAGRRWRRLAPGPSGDTDVAEDYDASLQVAKKHADHDDDRRVDAGGDSGMEAGAYAADASGDPGRPRMRIWAAVADAVMQVQDAIARMRDRNHTGRR